MYGLHRKDDGSHDSGLSDQRSLKVWNNIRDSQQLNFDDLLLI